LLEDQEAELPEALWDAILKPPHPHPRSLGRKNISDE